MAFRNSTHWKSMLDRLGGRSNFATATSPKMKPYNPAVSRGYVYETKPHNDSNPIRGDFVPVYVAAGMIMMSASLGIYTAMHQLRRNPAIHVKKSRRETIPEVVYPDMTVNEGEKFVKESMMRKIAHLQQRTDHMRGEVTGRPVEALTLKTVGVDPKGT